MDLVSNPLSNKESEGLFASLKLFEKFNITKI